MKAYLFPIRTYGNDAYIYHVSFEGAMIVTRSRDPEFDACRALKALGLTGKLQIIDANTGQHRLTVDIAKGAKLAAREDSRGMRFARWVPWETWNVSPRIAERTLGRIGARV